VCFFRPFHSTRLHRRFPHKRLDLTVEAAQIIIGPSVQKILETAVDAGQ